MGLAALPDWERTPEVKTTLRSSGEREIFVLTSRSMEASHHTKVIARLGWSRIRSVRAVSSRQQRQGRVRFEGEYPFEIWPWAQVTEVPRIGYAPSDYRMKPWPKEVLMEGWFPLAGEPKGLDVVRRANEADSQTRFDPVWARRSLCSCRLHRDHGSRCTSRLGADAGGQDHASFVRRTGNICLDLPFHGS